MGIETRLLVPSVQQEIKSVVCFLLRKGKVHLLLRTVGTDAGRFGTYSTDVRADETPPIAVVRELDNEAGVHARAADLHMVATINDTHVHPEGIVGRRITYIFVLKRWQGMPVPSAKWRRPDSPDCPNHQEWFDIPSVGKKTLAGIEMSPTQMVSILLRAAAT